MMGKKPDLPSRSSRSVQLQNAHLMLGSAITIGALIGVILFVQKHWIFQALLTSDILLFARVPHSLFLFRVEEGPWFLDAIPPTFLIDKASFAGNAMLILVAAALLAMLVVAAVPRLSPPMRTVAGFYLVLVLVNIAYEVLHPEQPSPLQIDWLTSGIVIIPLIALVFNVAVFPVPGPLTAKLMGLAACLIFSFAWSTVRFSLATASLYYLGTFCFMFLEYLPGAFVDFVYVLLFYSLVMHRLATSQEKD